MKLHDKVEKILQELYELRIPDEINSLQDENIEQEEEISNLKETIRDLEGEIRYLEKEIRDLQNQ